jgi:hypothetical protein
MNDNSQNHDVIITVLGGCVNGVFTDIPNAKVVLLDWDDINDSPVETLNSGPARTRPFSLSEMPDETRRVYEDYISRFTSS